MKEGTEFEDNVPYSIKVKLKGNSEAFKEGRIIRLKFEPLIGSHKTDTTKTQIDSVTSSDGIAPDGVSISK